jgi:hypothetical protein
MCLVTTQPELLASGIRSAAAGDVSASTTAQFGAHAQIYQGASAQAGPLPNTSPPRRRSLPVCLPASGC